MKIDYKFENMNTYINVCRRNAYLANKVKQEETELARLYFRNEPKVKNYPVEIVFKWHIKNKNSDLDGKVFKNILDGMVRAGTIIDDSVKYISKITSIYVPDNNDYVEVEIIER